MTDLIERLVDALHGLGAMSLRRNGCLAIHAEGSGSGFIIEGIDDEDAAREAGLRLVDKAFREAGLEHDDGIVGNEPLAPKVLALN